MESQLLYNICWNPKEVGYNASEGMDFPVRTRASTWRASFLLPCPYTGCHKKVRLRLKVNLPISKDLELKVDLPTSNELRKKITHIYTLLLGF